MTQVVTNLIISLILFFALPQIIIVILTIISKKMKEKRYMYDKQGLKEALAGVPLSTRISRIRRFAFKESHQKHFYIIINTVLFLGQFYLINSGETLLSLIYAFVVPFIFNIVLKITTKSVLDERKIALERLFEFKRAKMGLVDKKATPDFYETELQVVEYEDDLITPLKIRIFIPVTYDDYYKESFLRGLTQGMGGEREWVIDITDEEYPGWDQAKGVATLIANPTLPDLAPWHERYVLHPHVAWSFFPLGIGTKGGILLENPETGEMEHVVGFDVAGEQAKLSRKIGMPIGKEIVASPQTLVAGTTGSGKALSLDTEVFVLTPIEDDNV